MTDIIYDIVTNPKESTGTTFAVIFKQTKILKN
jgi:hypothetical protein